MVAAQYHLRNDIQLPFLTTRSNLKVPLHLLIDCKSGVDALLLYVLLDRLFKSVLLRISGEVSYNRDASIDFPSIILMWVAFDESSDPMFSERRMINKQIHTGY